MPRAFSTKLEAWQSILSLGEATRAILCEMTGMDFIQ